MGDWSGGENHPWRWPSWTCWFICQQHCGFGGSVRDARVQRIGILQQERCMSATFRTVSEQLPLRLFRSILAKDNSPWSGYLSPARADLRSERICFDEKIVFVLEERGLETIWGNISSQPLANKKAKWVIDMSRLWRYCDRPTPGLGGSSRDPWRLSTGELQIPKFNFARESRCRNNHTWIAESCSLAQIITTNRAHNPTCCTQLTNIARADALPVQSILPNPRVLDPKPRT
jgi:hypothetical protein